MKGFTFLLVMIVCLLLMAFARIALLCHRFSRQQQQRQLHRPFTTNLDNTRFLHPNQSKLAQNLITIFTRQPFSSDDPDLLKLTPEINTKVVETVLNGFKRGILGTIWCMTLTLLSNHELDGGPEIVKLLKDYNKAILLDTDSLSIVIDCLVTANKVDMAVTLLHDIVQNGLTPSLMM